MLVLIVNPVSELSGSSQSLLTLAFGLARTCGVRVEVALGEPGWLANELTDNGIAVHQIAHPRLSSHGSAKHQARYLAKFMLAANAFRVLCETIRPNVVHLNTAVSPFALVGARAARVGCIVHYRERVNSNWVHRALSVLNASLSSHIVANSKFMLSELLPVRRAASVVYNGFAVPCAANRARREPGLVLNVTRVCPDKGTDLVLETFQRVRNVLPNAKLEVVGGVIPGYERFADRMKEKASAPELRESVVFAGWKRDPAESYGRASVLVQLPRVRESFGRTLVEAGLRGLPCVAFKNGGMAEIVQDQVTGFLVPQGDVALAASRVCEILSNPALGEKLGANARALMREQFSEAAYVEGMLAVYRQVAGTHPEV